ncbi:iron complex outermembrane recepter protein [Epsilonproteobacteria bacterium SCGC AD-308-O04]|nr:iron complex outermembrane recepter protein [Epsilonproteobacteria bacterium SCGC AD-308-O04]
MNKIIPLSLIAVASLYAADVTLAPINVESTVITEVSQNAQVSADLAEALSSSVPSIDISRRSGIANDVLIRGQKRDNISIEVDGTKVHGACPNRMDPPVSHILANQIDEVEVIEGPYDVTTFGTMSGGLKITTKKPTKDLHGEVNLGFGSWNYKKVGATVSGGNDIVRVLVSGSSESSNQYVDGNGDTLAEQRSNEGFTPPASTTNQDSRYAPNYEDMKAYTKRSVMAKAFVTVTDNQELQLSATANRSDDVLYPNSSMDAAYDYSNIYSVAYDVKNISDIYKDVNLQYYYSDVDHPMDTKFRNSGATKYMTAQLKTTMQGLKLKNTFDIEGHTLLIGLDGSKRTWEGGKYRTDVNTGTVDNISTMLTHTDTKNRAIFAKLDKSFGDLDVTLGARYDSTEITPDDITKQSNDYNALNANILTSYNLTKENKIFFGIGQASRVPDARELYIVTTGTPNLNQTTNQEVDLGYELENDLMKFKIKGFYSKLKDYIYYNKSLATSNFQNIDATVYGAELSASIYATDDITVDMGASYKKGEKDNALAGQTDKDLADIAPLRGNLAVNYEYMNQSVATLEVQTSDKWDDIDSDNGEQTLDAWTVLNFKVKHAVNKNFDFTLGVNNLLDETYAKSNTYADLILVSTGTTDVMLLNEPGRYVYTNLTFKF